MHSENNAILQAINSSISPSSSVLSVMNALIDTVCEGMIKGSPAAKR